MSLLTRARALTISAVAVAAVLSALGAPTVANAADVPVAPVAVSGSAADVLATLPVKGKAAVTGYARTAQFGRAWLDVDRNGCDTRDDILARDLSNLTRRGSCVVLTGRLTDPYTGATLLFTRGPKTSDVVQIDHIVALENAWVTGAQRLSSQQRTLLANDPLNLLAVDGRSNAKKGAGDAATWLPANKSFRCEYVSRQIAVKAAYGLWVTRAEHDAMARVLTACPGQAVKSSAFAGGAAPSSPAAPVPTSTLVPVAPAPAPADPPPAPAAPAPAPVAPAPAPAPVAPAPAPAPVAPVPAPAQAGGATALCSDGTLSYAASHRGACSHHGGVAAWYK
ncbi:GmrSD restriction endonuclease domain-containing protein [Microbacterium sp. ASV81]|uniref:DUF1524 domain-containing protein n=1 Tax=Microbacterium capsulatum TaxID=3041921 RepID=A0ABU0XHX3_9MICO|nr:DUF1524 domain-containing protein [Microbacterium sp. ASV81]MDQ4214737.1 DUF1524 domain-containing protein [Microbacterium sp. ASV81]